jgi:NAD(P)-dependent dehydrogenase (short-subunit alcohol dehydrogenase family)
MSGQLDGKVAIITGGGKGLGKGISRRFLREGAKVVIAEIDGDAAAETASKLQSELGGAVLGLRTDVGVKEDIEAAVAATVAHFGSVHILVNNAAMLSPNILLEDKTDEMMRRTLEIALWGSWWAMRAVLPHFRANGGGSIVNFYSIDAEVGAWLHSDYNIAKSAILGLTRSAAMEWARFNVRVNAIAPTGIGTVFEHLIKHSPGFLELVGESCPLGRAGDPEDDIGPPVVFLASEASRFITGELLHVDGGQHLPGYNSKPPNLDLGGGK